MSENQQLNANFGNMEIAAKQMRSEGSAINKELNNIYKIVDTEIRQGLFGWEIYNELIKPFNNLMLPLNKVIANLCDVMPQTLEKIVQSYRRGGIDQGNTVISGDVKVNITLISNQTNTKDDFVDKNFDLIKLEDQRKRIMESFNNIMDELENFNKNIISIGWSGSTADSFRTVYMNAKTDITSALREIESKFQEIITKVTQQMDETDKAVRNAVNNM